MKVFFIMAFFWALPALSDPEVLDPSLDLKDKHPIVVVADNSPEAEGIPRRPDTVLVKNFNHQHRTYIAEIPLSELKSCLYFVSKLVTASPARSGFALSARGLKKATTPFQEHPMFARGN